jgi:hypothetical protein
MAHRADGGTMDRTPILDMPYVLPQQAQAHVTHNEAIRTLDSLVQLTVLDRDLAAPPGAPAHGDRYIVGPAATGAWERREDAIAAWQDGEWVFSAPLAGWHGWLVDEAMFVMWSGSDWQALTAADLAASVALLGINTTADTTSRLSVKSDAVLFAATDDGDGDMRLNLSKTAAGDTTSLIFQTGFSGRAEFGLAGTDDFSVKVSADGSAWNTAMTVAASTGRVTFPRAGALADIVRGHFTRADPASVVFTRTGAGTVSIKAGTVAELGGLLYPFPSATAVAMPTLAAGTDYAIYLCNDGVLRADSSFTAPTGFDTTTNRMIGGFHYAPGSNAAASSGGNTTPQVNEYSLWDLAWRPACADPRGMALVAGAFWCDIYLLGVNHHANGTSRNAATIADGSNPPKVPTAFGGNGTTAYANFNWWTAAEVMASHGKRLLSPGEFAAMAYGTTESASRGNDAVTTGLSTTNSGSSNADHLFTSRWGIIQSTGVQNVWSGHFGPQDAGASWADITGARGQVYHQPTAAILGLNWASGANAGSRAAMWHNQPSASNEYMGARGAAAHQWGR